MSLEPVDPRATQAALDQLFVYMRTLAAHGVAHPATAQAGDALAAALRAAAPPFSLQFIRQAVFRDRAVLPLEVESFVRAQALAKALASLGVQELSFDEMPEAGALAELGKALARGAQGPSDVLETLRLPAIRWRELENARLGMDAEAVDPEVFAAAQASLAVADAEQLCAGAWGGDATAPPAPWSWPAGVSSVRRLERACAVRPQIAIRAIELAPGAWTPPRRAIAAALRAGQVLRHIGASEFMRRAVAHATLALAAHGYRARGGDPAPAAAARALKALLDAPITARSGVDPHRLRVCAILHAMVPPAPTDTTADAGAEAGRTQPPAVVDLMRLCYDLERWRAPEDLPFDLGTVDLLARAAEEMSRSQDPAWVRALVSSVGVVPPGAFVRLADGRLAVVVDEGASGDPWRPRVLISGSVIEADAPVTLYPPLAAAGEAASP